MTKPESHLSVFLVVVVVACSSLAGASPAATNESSQAIPVQEANHLVEQLSRGDPEAFNVMARDWISPAEGAAIAGRARAQWKALETSFPLQAGERIPGEWERLGTRQLGSSLVKYIYLLKFDHGVLPVAVGYYRATDRWQMGALLFGDAAREDLQIMERRAEAAPEAVRTAVEPVINALSRGATGRAAAQLRELWDPNPVAGLSLPELEHRLQSGHVLQKLQMGKSLPGQHECLGTTAHGRSLTQILFLVKHERGFMPWAFRFYRARDRWTLIGFASGSDVSAASLALVAKVAVE